MGCNIKEIGDLSGSSSRGKVVFFFFFNSPYDVLQLSKVLFMIYFIVVDLLLAINDR